MEDFDLRLSTFAPQEREKIPVIGLGGSRRITRRSRIEKRTDDGRSGQTSQKYPDIHRRRRTTKNAEQRTPTQREGNSGFQG